jgi:hypothetical protein
MYRLWSDEEIDILKKNYPYVDNKELSQLLPNRSLPSIQHKAVRLGLIKKIRWWTPKEIDILKENWATSSRPRLLKLLPNKDWSSIRHKAVQLGLAKKAFAKYWRTYDKVKPIRLTDIEKGYLAGLIDGEGTIRIVRALRKWYAPLIQITNTDKSVMDWLQEIFGKKKIGHLYIEKDKRSPNHRPKLVYNIASVQGVKQILEQIVDILKIKKRQALLVLEFIKLKENKADYGVLPREIEIFEELKKLNARGKRKSLI